MHRSITLSVMIPSLSRSLVNRTIRYSPTYRPLQTKRTFSTTLLSSPYYSSRTTVSRSPSLFPSSTSTSSSSFLFTNTFYRNQDHSSSGFRGSTGMVLTLVGLLYTQYKHTSNADGASNNKHTLSGPSSTSLFSFLPNSSLFTQSISSLSAIFGGNPSLSSSSSSSPSLPSTPPNPPTFPTLIPSSITNLLPSSANILTRIPSTTTNTIPNTNSIPPSFDIPTLPNSLPSSLPMDTASLNNYLTNLSKEELSLQISFGSIAGFCSGYAVKKIGRLSALLIGVGFISVQMARSQGLLTNMDTKIWEKAESSLIEKLDTDGDGKLTVQDMRNHLSKFINVLGFNVPGGAAFTTAFLIGLKWG